MSEATENTYPKEEGWMRMTVTHVSAKARSEEEIKRIITLGKVELFEFGPVRQYGKRVQAVLREKK